MIFYSVSLFCRLKMQTFCPFIVELDANFFINRLIDVADDFISEKLLENSDIFLSAVELSFDCN